MQVYKMKELKASSGKQAGRYFKAPDLIAVKAVNDLRSPWLASGAGKCKSN
jgi:hypothetical protein